MARRVTLVQRNLDDALLIGNLISLGALQLVTVWFCVMNIAEVLTGVFTALPPNVSFVWTGGSTFVAAVAARMVERRQGQDYLTGLVGYYVGGAQRTIYSAAAPDAFRGHRLEELLYAGRLLSPAPSRRAGSRS